MKKKLSLVMFVAMFTMFTIGIGWACNRQQKAPLFKNLSGLNLTEKQTAKLETKKMDHCKKMIQLKANLAIAKLEKQKMIKDRNFKSEEVKKQIEKIMDIKTEMQMAKLEVLAKLSDILTDDQWKQFSTMITKRGRGSYGKNNFEGGRHSRGRGHCRWDRDGDWNHKDRKKDCPYFQEKLKNENLQ